MANRVSFNFDALIRRAAQFTDLSTKQLAQVKSRTVATLKRRLGPEAARQISDNILNLTSRQISPYLIVKVTADGIALTGSSSRLPVSAFKPTWAGRSSPGVVVTFWRDAGPLLLAHTFMRRDSKEVWMRVPGARSRTQLVGTGRDSSRVVVREASGLVGRLPIVVRKGPSFARAVYERRHGDIYPALSSFGGQLLSDESARLLALFRAK
jgi:hypothetical protein